MSAGMNIFISSVIRGLESERDAAAEAVAGLGHTPKRAEDFAASPESPQIVCRRGVRESDVVVLLLGERYGEVQASGKSATHEEFEEAQLLMRPTLAFLQTGVTREPDQERFAAEVRDWVGGEFHGRFASPTELDRAITRSLHELEVSMAGGPVDPAETYARARAAIRGPRNPSYRPAQIAVAVAGGPHMAVLRPGDLERADLAAWVQQEAMFGAAPVLDRSQATATDSRDGRLALTQQGREVAIDADGTVLVVQPAYEASDRSALQAVVEEHVEERIDAAVTFAGRVLEHIDPLRRVSDHVVVAALVGTGYGAWRSRAEQQASPNSMSMNIQGRTDVVARLPQPGVIRPALLSRHAEFAADLTVLLRRAATEPAGPS